MKKMKKGNEIEKKRTSKEADPSVVFHNRNARDVASENRCIDGNDVIIQSNVNGVAVLRAHPIAPQNVCEIKLLADKSDRNLVVYDGNRSDTAARRDSRLHVHSRNNPTGTEMKKKKKEKRKKMKKERIEKKKKK